MGKPQPNIAVIGPSQSGKTCLAAGLYNIEGAGRTGLTVEAPDRATQDYLESVMRYFAKRSWPDATIWEKEVESPGPESSGAGFPSAVRTKTKTKDIRLDFNDAQGQATRIGFVEFPGEIVSDDDAFTGFANEHFRNLDGVVLLVNPGMDAFADHESREPYNQCMNQYRRIIKYLGNRNNGPKPHVALTVTAADRLESDLKDSPAAKRFRKFLKGIQYRLRARLFDMETFYVSITGPLEDQQSPQLADGEKITAAEPFLWLVDRITNYPERVGKWKRRAIIAAVAAILAVTGGCWWHLARIDCEGKLLKGCKQDLETCSENTLPSTEQLAAAKKALSQLRGKKRWLSSGNAAKAKELLTQYGGEVDRARCEHAVRNPDLNELVRLLDEAQTNMNLAGWTNRLESAYGIAYSNFIDDVATDVVQRPGVPTVTGGDEKKIRQKANEVGPRFHADEALEALRKRVEDLSDPQRAACLKWVRENISPRTPRTGTKGLLRGYVHAKDHGELKGNPFCNDIVRTNVYDQYGRWLEEDVANYPSQVTVALFDGKKEARENFEKWLGQFRDTCRELAGTDDPDPDKSSWAYQFAKRSMEEDRFPDVALDAFPQTFAVTHIDCRVDYGGKFPVNHKRTSFKASLRILDPATWKPGKPIPIFNGGDIREKDEKKWVTVWTNGFKHTGGLFTMALHLEAEDEQNWVSIAGTFGGSRDKSFSLADVPIAALKLHKAKDERQQDCWEFEQEVGLGRATGADKVRFAVRVYGKLEGKTPGSLAKALWDEGKWRRPPQEGMAE